MRTTFFLFNTLVFFLLTACDEAGWVPRDQNSDTDTNQFFGPGVWELDLQKDADFQLTRKSGSTSTHLDIKGTYTTHDNGFSLLTVENPSDNTPATIAALRIANQAAILMPAQTNSEQLIVLTPSGTCPENNLTGNWISYKHPDDLDTSDEDQYFFGRWRYNVDPYEMESSDEYSLAGDDSGGGKTVALEEDDCDDGLAGDDTNQRYYLSTRGVAMAEEEDDAVLTYYRFGMPRGRVGTVANFDDDNYVGLLYDSENGESATISAECDAGECTIYSESNVAEVSRADASRIFDIILENPDEPERGFVLGDIVDPEDEDITGAISCMVNLEFEDTDNKLLSCVGQFPAANNAGEEVINIFLYANTGSKEESE